MKKTSHLKHIPQRRHVIAYVALACAVIFAAVLYIYNERAASRQYNETDQQTSLIVRTLTSTDHVIGERSAPVQLVVFSDLACPYCNNFFVNTLPRLQEKYGAQIVVAYRHLPLEDIHPRAFRAAQASECAAQLGGEPAFWKFERGVYATPEYETGLSDAELGRIATAAGINHVQFSQCMESGEAGVRVRADMMEARVAGLNYTPSTVLKSKHRAIIVKGSYYPRFVGAIDYLLSVEQNIREEQYLR